MKLKTWTHTPDPWLTGLTAEWSRYLSAFEEEFAGSDLPWVYKEETNVGLMACAASKLEALALVESRISTKAGGWGFLDLWISGSVNGETHNADFEMKSINTTFSKRAFKNERFWDLIDDALDTAESDINEIAEDNRSERGYAAVFVPLKFSESVALQSRRDIEALRKEFEVVVSSLGSVKSDFAALHNADSTSWLGSAEHNSAGVAFISRRVW